MILQALSQLYSRLFEEGRAVPEGFKRLEVPFLITITEAGEFVDLQDTRVPSGKKLVARSFVVPQERARSGSKSWQTANLLWDHFGYVLGWPKSESPEHRDMAERQRGAFLAEVAMLCEALPGDRELAAVSAFLSRGDFTAVFSHPSWPECAKIPGCNLSFVVVGQQRLVCESDAVRSFVERSLGAVDDSEESDDGALPAQEGVCLVNGEVGPVARLHPRTPIPGAKSNAKIVSFQKNMGFDSYGRQQSYNAPTGRKAAFAYATALNHMLAKDSRQRLSVGDATAVFWAERRHVIEDVFADFFGEQPKDAPSQDLRQVVALYRSPQSGVRPELDPATRFFVLGLAPNAARLAVRFWHAGTVGEVAANLEAHFDDLAIVAPAKWSPHLSLRTLLKGIAAQGDLDNVPPNLAGDFMKAILAGTPYPRTLLSQALRRVRAERDVIYPRAAVIKAILARQARTYGNREKEVGMSLDPQNTNVGYRLGRLFAALEKVQEEASPGINATIRDRFYGSASAMPVAAFPHLMKLKNHHVAKLENRGRAVNLERLIGEIVDGVADFPAHLSLQDQGRFAVGYYHQRQDFFRKRDTSTAEA
jgi:CRISPR-associated protein Csd1